MRVLPPVGQRVKVSFYSAAAEDLAIHHPLLRTLLSAAGKPRWGAPACLPQDHANRCAGRHASEPLHADAPSARRPVHRGRHMRTTPSRWLVRGKQQHGRDACPGAL